MTWLRLAATALLMLAAVGPSGRQAVSQQVPNRSLSYLFPTTVTDARAIWVNPAGLGIQHEASLYGELGVEDPGAKGKLRQLDIGFNSRGLAFSYQRDIFDNGQRASTYRLGLGFGAQGLAAGFAVARYSSGPSSTGWDLGGTYDLLAGLRVGLVVANLGQPVVRGAVLRAMLVPGVTWQPTVLPNLAVSADARITTDSVASYAFGAGWRTGSSGVNPSRWPIEIIARLDTDRGLRRSAFAFGFSIGGQDRGGLVATTPGDVSRINELSVYALSSRAPASGRR